MSFPKRKFQVTSILIIFILNLALIPSMIHNSYDESQILLSEPFHTNYDHEDLIIDGDWSNVSTSYGGFLEIKGSGTVSFNNCTFYGTYLKIYENAIVSFTNQCNLTYNDEIEIYGDAMVTFQDSTIITNGEITDPGSVNTELDFKGNAKVTFQGCTVETNELHGDCNEINITQSTLTVRPLSEDADPLYNTDLHRFKLAGSSKITFDNSTVSCPWDSLLELWDDANLTIRKNSSLDVDFDIRLLQSSTVTIDNSTIEAGEIRVVQDQSWYKNLPSPPYDASLTIINSTIHSSILDGGIDTSVTIQNGSKVDIMTNFTMVEGSLTIFNNTITSGTNYTTKPFTIDGSSTINDIQHIVIGMNESQILIESSQIYAVLAAWNSTINISNSIITSTISTVEHANVTLMNSSVLGNGDASIYGAVGGLQATYYSSASSNFYAYSFISLTGCTIYGKILPYGYTTIILQNSNYNTSDLACIQLGIFTKEVLVVERESPIDLNISGWIENGPLAVEEITSANLTVNGENGTADPNDSLHFMLDPVTHQIPGLADLEIVAYDDAEHSFSRNFTIEILSDAPPKEVFWNTTSEFQNYVENNCTIGTDNLTCGLVNIAYDFTEDDNGDDPAGWTTIESSEDDIEVIQEIDGHGKVVKIYCPSGSQNIDNEFADAATGTTEFWLRTSDAAQASVVFIRDSVLADSIMFGIYSDYFYYASNAYPEGTPIITAYDNTWYHLRVQWNCSSGWYVWINGAQYGEYDFYGSPTAMDDIMFADFNDGGHTFYVDAVDYSWASGYYTERSYEHYGEKYYANCTWISTITDLDASSPYYNTITFSCDTNVNTSVNISYRMSHDNSSWDEWSAWSSSNISLNAYGKRYFQVKTWLTTNNTDQSPLLRWINVSYHVYFRDLLWNTTSDFENYAENNCTIGTHDLTLTPIDISFDFTEDAVGTEPAGWTVEKGSKTHCLVVASQANHAKVVEIWDDSTPNNVEMNQSFTGQTTGTIEFWIYGIEGGTTATDYLDIVFSDDLEHENFRLQANWNTGDDDLIQHGTEDIIIGSGNFSSDTWHHLRVWWNCTSDKFKVWHDTEYKGEYDMRYANYSNVGAIKFTTYTSDSKSDFYAYLDAIDYSWETGYFTERSYNYYGDTYYSNGTWRSEAIDLEVEAPYYETLNFSCDTNEDTSVSISYRMSHDNSSWDEWSAWSSTNISLNAYGKRYCQVKVLLTTNDTSQTPTLFSIEVKTYFF